MFLCELLGCSWGFLGSPWMFFGFLWDFLGSSWVASGPLVFAWGLLGIPLGFLGGSWVLLGTNCSDTVRGGSEGAPRDKLFQHSFLAEMLLQQPLKRDQPYTALRDKLFQSSSSTPRAPQERPKATQEQPKNPQDHPKNDPIRFLCVFNKTAINN